MLIRFETDIDKSYTENYEMLFGREYETDVPFHFLIASEISYKKKIYKKNFAELGINLGIDIADTIRIHAQSFLGFLDAKLNYRFRK